MATRARIGIMQEDGNIVASYQHWDGYPGGLGYNLIENWEDPKKVTEAIMLGDSSKWHYIIGDKIDFDDRKNPMHDVQNVYYMRDRGEKNCNHKVYTSEEAYIKNGFNSGEEYIYLMKMDGKQDWSGNKIGTWYYVASRYTETGKEAVGNVFKPLLTVAIKEHIEILQRYMEREVA